MTKRAPFRSTRAARKHQGRDLGRHRADAPSRRRFRNDPVPRRVDPAEMDVRPEAPPRLRPDVGRRGPVKKLRVAFKRPGIPVVELVPLAGSALRRPVMQRLAEHPAAELLPIRARVEQVQVPRLVHLVRRRDRMPRRHGEEGEALVFADDAARVRRRPAVVAREPCREGKRDGLVGLVVFEAGEKLGVLGVHKIFRLGRRGRARLQIGA